MNEPSWVQPPHPLHRLVQGQPAGDAGTFTIPNIRMFNVFKAVIPQYFTLTATVAAAEQRARELHQAAAATQWPTAPEAITTEWIEEETARRSGTRSIDVQRQILRELAFYARTDANDLITENATEMIRAVAKALRELVDRAGTALEDLPANVHTAVQAIETSTVGAWTALHNMRREYDDIRDVQRALYRGLWGSVDWPFSRDAAGDSPDVADKEARLYFHKNLPDIAPHWRTATASDSFGNTQRHGVPWPDDPTERFIWCIRNDSGIWCPTEDQMSARLNTVPPRNGRSDEPQYQGMQRARSEQRVLHPSAVSGLR